MKTLKDLLQVIHVQAVFLAFNGNQIRLIQPHALQIAQEGGILYKDDVAGVNGGFAEKIHGLGGAGDRKHRGHRTAQQIIHVSAEAFHERRIAFGGTVLKNGFAVLSEDLDRELGNLLIWERGKGGIAPGKRDHAGLGDDLENLADSAAGNGVKTMRKMQ